MSKLSARSKLDTDKRPWDTSHRTPDRSLIPLSGWLMRGFFADDQTLHVNLNLSIKIAQGPKGLI